MKILGWYTVIFEAALILMLILTSAGVLTKPPFSWFETLIWALFSVPVVILGWVTTRREK